MKLILRAIAATLVALFVSTVASAQTVVVAWGDSLVSGFSADAADGTPYGTEPFGPSVPGARRWSTALQDWIPVTPYQNTQGIGADPIYGFCAAWRRFQDEPIYVIGGGIPGTDCAPILGNRSWHPAAQDSLLLDLTADIQAALATLPAPELRAVFFSTGNNVLTPDLVANIDAVNAVIAAQQPGSTPSLLGIRAWQLAVPDTSTNRALLPVWATGPGRRRVIDASTFPARTGGLPDMVHLTHFGSIFLGYFAVVIETYT